MNKYLEKIAELQKEAMKPEKVLAAAEKSGLHFSSLSAKMIKQRDKITEGYWKDSEGTLNKLHKNRRNWSRLVDASKNQLSKNVE